MDPLTISAIAGVGSSLLDAGLGFFSGQEQSEQQREAARRLLAGIEDARGIYGDAYSEMNAMYDPFINRGEQAFQQMQYVEGELDPSKNKLPTMGEFDYQGDVQSFLSPSMQFQMDEGMRALEGSAAAAGGLLSGKALKDSMRFSQGLASQEYGNAYNRMMQDKNFAYQNFLDQFESERAAVQDRYQKMADKYGRAGAQYDIGRSAVGTQANLRGNLAENMANLRTQEANVLAQKEQIPSWLQNLAGQSGKIGSVIGSFSGSFGGGSSVPPNSQGIPATQSISAITG